MQIILSPAKKLDFESEIPTKKYTQPLFSEESQTLARELKKRKPEDLKEMMGISHNLALLNAERYQNWQMPFSPETARQAVFAFNGEVYEGLQARKLTENELDFAQEHVSILSGLHGLLRPLDLILPYRLEMGSKFKTQHWKNLYDFWGDKITNRLNQTGDEVLLNLASQEYFKVIHKKKLKLNVITPVFKELKGEQYRMVSFYAKKARGMMARYAIENKINRVEELKNFSRDGYRFHESLSDAQQWVFTR